MHTAQRCSFSSSGGDAAAAVSAAAVGASAVTGRGEGCRAAAAAAARRGRRVSTRGIGASAAAEWRPLREAAGMRPERAHDLDVTTNNNKSAKYLQSQVISNTHSLY